MPRPAGSKNPAYAKRRQALALAALGALTDERGEPTSFRALARAAGVTVPTLKHYFGDHDGIVQAALEAAERMGRDHIARFEDPQDMPMAASMAEAARDFVEGWRFGVGHMFTGALTHGLGHATRGPAFVNHLLEPTLQGLEVRLATHHRRGELVDCDVRLAALAFLSPLIMALLHQHQLSGAACRPLDIDAFVEGHVAGWLRGYALSSEPHSEPR